jgi:mitochondrial fission protein ELM1
MGPSQSSPYATERAQDRSHEVAEQAKQTAQEAMHTVQERTRSTLSQQKDRAASSLDNVAQALRDTGEQLRSHDQASFADYAVRAADQLELFSESIRTKDVNEMVGDVERFARRQPEIFLGAAFTLGLLAARFFKSSSRASEEEMYNRPYMGREMQGGMGSQHVRTYPSPETGTPGVYGGESTTRNPYGPYTNRPDVEDRT